MRMDEENNLKQAIQMEVRGTLAKRRPQLNIRHVISKCGLDDVCA